MASFYRAPRKGSTVRLVFEGVVTGTDLHNVRLRTATGTATVGWGSGIRPEVEIVDEGLQDGDIGVYTYDNGVNETVIYHSQFKGESPFVDRPEGWYPANIHNSSRLAAPMDRHVTLIVRANGDLVQD